MNSWWIDFFPRGLKETRKIITLLAVLKLVKCIKQGAVGKGTRGGSGQQ